MRQLSGVIVGDIAAFANTADFLSLAFWLVHGGLDSRQSDQRRDAIHLPDPLRGIVR